MQTTILVIHTSRPLADAIAAAFGRSGFAATAVRTLDEALDCLCARGRADVIFYEGCRPEIAWGFRRAQDANPALLGTLMIALTPLDYSGPRSRDRDVAGPIDVSALLLIVQQFCRRAPASRRSQSERW